MQLKQEFKITIEHVGYTIVDFLSQHLMDYDKNTLKKMIHKQFVSVNSRDVLPNRKLHLGDKVKVYIPKKELHNYPQTTPDLDIIFEDDDFLIINKKIAISKYGDIGPLKKAVKKYLKSNPDTDCNPKFVQNIEREVTGAVLIAKNTAIEKYLIKLFERNLVTKEYLALVSGTPEEQGTIDLKIAKGPKYMEVRKDGTLTFTKYNLIEKLGDFSLIKASTLSALKDQVRLHLAHHGYPLAVDPVYGFRKVLNLSEIKKKYKPKKGVPEKPLISRVSLHLHKIHFLLPNAQPIKIEAPMAKDLQIAIKKLRKYSENIGVQHGNKQSGK